MGPTGLRPEHLYKTGLRIELVLYLDGQRLKFRFELIVRQYCLRHLLCSVSHMRSSALFQEIRMRSDQSS